MSIRLFLCGELVYFTGHVVDQTRIEWQDDQAGHLPLQ